MPNFVQDDDTAISPNWNIFFPQNICYKDFSKENIPNQTWFIHEMWHVFQYQNQWQTLFWKATKLVILDTWIKWKDVYFYEIDENKKLTDYNVEQQWDIFADYFLYLHWEKQISKEDIFFYKKILNFN